jgi:hypothetical protein
MVLGRFIDIIVALTAATWLAMAGASGDVQAAAYDTSRLERMPDFTQTDARLGLPGGGKNYCVPVATANVLVWLAEHKGYKNLLPIQGLTTIEKVASVAGQLGSAQFMSTAPKGGTNLQRFVTGLSAYIEQQGYSTSIDSYGPYGFSNVRRAHVGRSGLAQHPFGICTRGWCVGVGELLQGRQEPGRVDPRRRPHDHDGGVRR